MYKRIEEYEEGTLTVWGKEFECGCKEFQTVLTDGTLGLGEWVSECPTCFFTE